MVCYTTLCISTAMEILFLLCQASSNKKRRRNPGNSSHKEERGNPWIDEGLLMHGRRNKGLTYDWRWIHKRQCWLFLVETDQEMLYFWCLIFITNFPGFKQWTNKWNYQSLMYGFSESAPPPPFFVGVSSPAKERLVISNTISRLHLLYRKGVCQLLKRAWLGVIIVWCESNTETLNPLLSKDVSKHQ